MSQDIDTAATADLGGKKLAKQLAARITKTQTLVKDPVKAGRLKKASRQLKSFSKKLAGGLSSGKVKGGIGTTLETLAADAQGELTGLMTGP